MLCCVAALGPALTRTIIWSKTYVIAICYNLVTMHNSYNLSQKYLITNMKMSSYFWVVKELQLPWGGYFTCHLLGSLFKIIWDPQMQIQCIYIGQTWKKILNRVLIKILNCILNSFFIFFFFFLDFSMSKTDWFLKN